MLNELEILDESENIPSKNCRRLLVLGSSRCGKTSIIQRFLNNRFDERYTPTIEEFHSKVYKIRGETYRLDILDTSGSHDPFPAMRRVSLLTGDLFLLVFSLDQADTWEEALRLREKVLECKGQSTTTNPLLRRHKMIPMVLVGNKCDLYEARQDDRAVYSDEIQHYLDRQHGCAYVEASALTPLHINEIFLKLFLLSGLPTEMTACMHKRVQHNYISPTPAPRKGLTFRRRISDTWGALIPNARRPSVRTDLHLTRMRSADKIEEKKRHRKCAIL